MYFPCFKAQWLLLYIKCVSKVFLMLAIIYLIKCPGTLRNSKNFPVRTSIYYTRLLCNSLWVDDTRITASAHCRINILNPKTATNHKTNDSECQDLLLATVNSNNKTILICGYSWFLKILVEYFQFSVAQIWLVHNVA